jgi:hypothetical protein
VGSKRDRAADVLGASTDELDDTVYKVRVIVQRIVISRR